MTRNLGDENVAGDHLSHPVLVLLLKLGQLSVKINTNLDIEIPPVPFVGVHLELPVYLLPLLAGYVVTQVEGCLLPVCVGCIWSSGEPGLLVAFGELHVEKRNKGLNVFVIVRLTIYKTHMNIVVSLVRLEFRLPIKPLHGELQVYLRLTYS